MTINILPKLLALALALGVLVPYFFYRHSNSQHFRDLLMSAIALSFSFILFDKMVNLYRCASLTSKFKNSIVLGFIK